MDKETHDQLGLMLEALKSQQVINKGVNAQLELVQNQLNALTDLLIAFTKAVK